MAVVNTSRTSLKGESLVTLWPLSFQDQVVLCRKCLKGKHKREVMTIRLFIYKTTQRKIKFCTEGLIKVAMKISFLFVPLNHTSYYNSSNSVLGNLDD
jgi:hypothetical protein